MLRVACYISDKIFQLAPADRLTAAQIIDHDWFKGDERPTSSQVTKTRREYPGVPWSTLEYPGCVPLLRTPRVPLEYP